MRSITVTLHCDWPGCDVAMPESVADGLIVERTLTIDKTGPRIFALCKSDNDALDEVLNPLLAKGLKAEAAAPKKKDPSSSSSSSAVSANVSAETCRVPTCGRPFKSRAGLGQHVIRSHDYTSLAEYDAEYVNPADAHPTSSG